MRRLSLFFLSAYIALTLYIYARSFLELPRQVWAFLRPAPAGAGFCADSQRGARRLA